MFDTYVTIVGNVLTAPEWRRTAQSNILVANFKVASTARRLNRDSGRWVDGNSLRVRVNCWRKLAEGVAASVMVGDPVVVAGRLYTRDWTDDAGNHRVLYELEAVAVGHDLSRGRSRFLRNRPSMATSAVEDDEAAQRVQGEPTEPVPVGQAPAGPDDRPLDDDFELSGFGFPRAGHDLPGHDLPGSGYAPATDPFDDEPDDDLTPLPDDGTDTGDDPTARSGDWAEPHRSGEQSRSDGPGVPGGAGRSGGEGQPDDAEQPTDGGQPGDGDRSGGAGRSSGAVATPGEVALGPAGRARRGRGRVPAPA
ncbi:single-stranded DNA-binding protein [Micromonospora sp. RL09-050-HVF-A]|uniref:single-stranded DNA-binding protein n=1 Tax=Micromonospora sp. RL09-050-HVF-A TaxID=1703433 RepID=UPI001C5E875F|nr:single-stranded DNA-binding protein [Micromonospora sp. RL09-050-HVF-A]MBW4702805.1 single-stranded DNA-binding protein [Micromonospora sp. RL09-050-HVF-A]